MSINQIRRALRDVFGTRKYRILASGEIHVFGKMPNTNQDGWYLYGWIGCAETVSRISEL
jgi:hypothetical protein